MGNFQSVQRDGERLPSIPHFGDMIETTILAVFYSPNTIPWACVLWVFSGPVGQRYSWIRFDGLSEGQKASTSVLLSPTPASIDYVIWSASSTGWKLRAFVQSKFKMKRTSVKPGFMYIDELLWNLGLPWWHENLGRIELCRVVWVGFHFNFA